MEAARPVTTTPTIERLVHYLLDGSVDEFAGELSDWFARSARFRNFAELYRGKIRKKLRGATDPEARRDVRTELRIAHLLLADRRVQVAFEAYGSGHPGPDFTVTRGGDRFNLEVTRLRGDPANAGFGGLLAKLRQLPPGVANGVVLAIEGTDASAYNVESAIAAVRARAGAKDDAFFVSRGFAGARACHERLARLGAAVVFAEAAETDRRSLAWVNATARIAFPARGMRACLACLSGGE